jgi:hypothetical protein
MANNNGRIAIAAIAGSAKQSGRRTIKMIWSNHQTTVVGGEFISATFAYEYPSLSVFICSSGSESPMRPPEPQPTTNSSLFTRFDRDAYLAARGGKPGGDCGAVQPLTNDDARIGTKTTENYDYDDPNDPPYMWMGRQCNDETYSYSQTQHDVPYHKETCRG